METSKATADVALRLERTIAATPEQVYRAWIETEALTRWFAPANDFTTVVHAIEPRVGGRYRIEMRSPDGVPHLATGVFRELDRPKRLVFTWQWEDDPDRGGETLVSVLLTPEGNGTRLVLLHERFVTAELRDKHQQGWTGCLDRLANAVPKS